MIVIPTTHADPVVELVLRTPPQLRQEYGRKALSVKYMATVNFTLRVEKQILPAFQERLLEI